MRLRWAESARAAYEQSIRFIAEQDAFAADLVRDRVSRSMQLIASHPGMGTPIQSGRARRYPIPRTGHCVNYVETSQGVTIVRWYRQKQNVQR